MICSHAGNSMLLKLHFTQEKVSVRMVWNTWLVFFNFTMLTSYLHMCFIPQKHPFCSSVWIVCSALNHHPTHSIDFCKRKNTLHELPACRSIVRPCMNVRGPLTHDPGVPPIASQHNFIVQPLVTKEWNARAF